MTTAIDRWALYYEENASEVHARSVALMKYLARVADALGIGDHVYVVGGAVRNWVLGEPIKDIDVVIDSIEAGRDSEWFARQLARAIPVATNLTTNQYGVAILTVKGEWDLDGYDMKGEVIEIANARAESYAKVGGYKPTEVRPATIEQDVYRREFRFNTLLWRLSDVLEGPEDAPIIDLTGHGLSDLEDRIIETPSPPDVTFSDDPTRMLRAVKFALRYDLEIPHRIAESIRGNAEGLKDMPWEPVATLFVNNVLVTDRAHEGLVMLDQLGLLDVLVDISSEQPPMRTFLSKQMRHDPRTDLLVKLLDAGFELNIPIQKFSPQERVRMMEMMRDMTDYEAQAYRAALERPPVDNRAIIAELQLEKRERGRIAPTAREVLLTEPDMAGDPAALTQRVIDVWEVV
jgi:tRNA nucleotidyltransferase/poly(A) polymerase